jgi:hypothetical protein
LPLGRLTASEVQNAARYLPASTVTGGVDHLNASDLSCGRVRSRIPRFVGYALSEEFKYDDNSSSAHVSSGLSTVYCAAFSSDLKKCTCSIHGDQIAVRSTICGLDCLPHNQEIPSLNSTIAGESNSLIVPRLLKFNETSPCASFAPVTLITVASFEEYQAGTLDRMLQSWCGPKVII